MSIPKTQAEKVCLNVKYNNANTKYKQFEQKPIFIIIIIVINFIFQCMMGCLMRKVNVVS